MAVITIGEDITVETVEPLCHYCMEQPSETTYGACGDCEDHNMGSDLYKDLHGFRPRWPREEVIAWYREQSGRAEA